MSDHTKSAKHAVRAARLNSVPAYPFGQWKSRCQGVSTQYEEIIHLDVGSPDLEPPDAVTQALARSERGSGQGYSSREQEAPLRQAIANYYERRFRVLLDAEVEVVPLLGSKEGIIHFSLATVDPGDVVLVPEPGYTPYRIGARLAGANVVPVPLSADLGYLPDLAGIPNRIARQTRLLWLNYPSNPTGATATRDFFDEVVAFSRKHGILVCHDAPYTEVFYGQTRPPSVLEATGAFDVAVEFNSFSKTYNMAGFRMGMAVGNRAALEALSQLKTNTDSGMVAPLLLAATAALSTDAAWIAHRNGTYRKRLEILVGALAQTGLDVRLPAAGPYLWTGIPEGCSSERVAIELLRRTGIALAPGTFFGESCDSYLRWSVTAPTDTIREAARRLREAGRIIGCEASGGSRDHPNPAK